MDVTLMSRTSSEPLTPEDDIVGFEHFAEFMPSADCWARVASAIEQETYATSGSTLDLTVEDAQKLVLWLRAVAETSQMLVEVDPFDLLWKVLPGAQINGGGGEGLPWTVSGWMVGVSYLKPDPLYGASVYVTGATPKEAATAAILKAVPLYAPTTYTCPVTGEREVPAAMRRLIFRLRFGKLSQEELGQLDAWAMEEPACGASRSLDVPLLVWIDVSVGQALEANKHAGG